MESDDLCEITSRQHNRAVNVEKELDYNDIIQNLPKKYKEMIIDFYYQKLKISEISFIRGVPEGTVKRRLYEARIKIKEKLEENENER